MLLFPFLNATSSITKDINTKKHKCRARYYLISIDIQDVFYCNLKVFENIAHRWKRKEMSCFLNYHLRNCFAIIIFMTLINVVFRRTTNVCLF